MAVSGLVTMPWPTIPKPHINFMSGYSGDRVETNIIELLLSVVESMLFPNLLLWTIVAQCRYSF
jgi:hypothetical protein